MRHDDEEEPLLDVVLRMADSEPDIHRPNMHWWPIPSLRTDSAAFGQSEQQFSATVTEVLLWDEARRETSNALTYRHEEIEMFREDEVGGRRLAKVGGTVLWNRYEFRCKEAHEESLRNYGEYFWTDIVVEPAKKRLGIEIFYAGDDHSMSLHDALDLMSWEKL